MDKRRRMAPAGVVAVLTLWVLWALAVAFLATPPVARAQEATRTAQSTTPGTSGSARLSTVVRDGRIVVEGSGFAPGAQVPVTLQVVEARGTPPQAVPAGPPLVLSATADEQGMFSIPTALTVPPVIRLQLSAPAPCSPPPTPTPRPTPTTTPGASPFPPQVSPPSQSACAAGVAAAVMFSSAQPAQPVPAGVTLPRTGSRPVAPAVLALLAGGGGAITGAGLWFRRRVKDRWA